MKSGCFKSLLGLRQGLYEYIDQSLLCFVGFNINGQVRGIPTCHWRDGDYLYWHGHSKAASIDGEAKSAEKVCITLAWLAWMEWLWRVQRFITP